MKGGAGWNYSGYANILIAIFPAFFGALRAGVVC
jgi:hypothetical protein